MKLKRILTTLYLFNIRNGDASYIKKPSKFSSLQNSNNLSEIKESLKLKSTLLSKDLNLLIRDKNLNQSQKKNWQKK